jgi:hypothetical protein
VDEDLGATVRHVPLHRRVGRGTRRALEAESDPATCAADRGVATYVPAPVLSTAAGDVQEKSGATTVGRQGTPRLFYMNFWGSGAA